MLLGWLLQIHELQLLLFIVVVLFGEGTRHHCLLLSALQYITYVVVEFPIWVGWIIFGSFVGWNESILGSEECETSIVTWMLEVLLGITFLPGFGKLHPEPEESWGYSGEVQWGLPNLGDDSIIVHASWFGSEGSQYREYIGSDDICDWGETSFGIGYWWIEAVHSEEDNKVIAILQ